MNLRRAASFYKIEAPSRHHRFKHVIPSTRAAPPSTFCSDHRWPGKVVLNNTHFDTTRAHVDKYWRRRAPANLVITEGR